MLKDFVAGALWIPYQFLLPVQGNAMHCPKVTKLHLSCSPIYPTSLLRPAFCLSFFLAPLLGMWIIRLWEISANLPPTFVRLNITVSMSTHRTFRIRRKKSCRFPFLSWKGKTSSSIFSKTCSARMRTVPYINPLTIQKQNIVNSEETISYLLRFISFYYIYSSITSRWRLLQLRSKRQWRTRPLELSVNYHSATRGVPKEDTF